MIISITKPSWANLRDDESYIEIEIRWPKKPPRGWAYIQEVHLRQIHRLLENGMEGKKEKDACVAANRMLRRAVSRSWK